MPSSVAANIKYMKKILPHPPPPPNPPPIFFKGNWTNEDGTPCIQMPARTGQFINVTSDKERAKEIRLTPYSIADNNGKSSLEVQCIDPRIDRSSWLSSTLLQLQLHRHVCTTLQECCTLFVRRPPYSRPHPNCLASPGFLKGEFVPEIGTSTDRSFPDCCLFVL